MCDFSKTRKIKPSNASDNLKREAVIEDIEQDLARWRKVTARNAALKYLEAGSERKIYQQQLKQINRETKLASKSLLLIRQAAMKKLLEAECQQYLEELHLQGKTICKDRL